MKNKGFTLIELLAVIVILAIIAVITIPMIMGVIDKAHVAAFEDSVKNAYGQIDYYLIKNDLTTLPEEGVSISELDVKSDFIGGKFINDGKEIIAYFIKNKNYCVYGSMKKLLIAKDCNQLDISYPEVDESKISVLSTSNSIKIYMNDNLANDIESGIKKYNVNLYQLLTKEEVKNLNTNGTSKSGDEYKLVKGEEFNQLKNIEFKGLKNGKKYKIEIIVTNGNDMKTTINKEITTKDIEIPIYKVSPSGWAQSKTVTIQFAPGFTNEYSIDDGRTWQEYNVPLVFNKNVDIIARISDGTNYVAGSSQTISGIDTTLPTLDLEHDDEKIVLNMNDSESLINSYCITMTRDKCDWNSTNGTETYVASIYGTYYIYVKDNANNIMTKTIDLVSPYVSNQRFNYDYTGNYQTFTALTNGYYKFEAWGAQGGSIGGVAYNYNNNIRNNNITYYGGKGAYTIGTVYLSKGMSIYIYVGGTVSKTNTTLVSGTYVGGYNGGGSLEIGQEIYGSPGGGATDFRLVSGNFNNFDSSKSRIMVAAGGGGANFRNQGYGEGNGGEGGALQGLAGYEGFSQGSYHRPDYLAGYNIGYGGTQTSGGYLISYYLDGSELKSQILGSFGGIGATSNLVQSGSGGGYYTGGYSAHGGAGGGSSFVSGYTGCNAITDLSTSTNIVHSGQPNHYSGYVFSNSNMIAGNAAMPTHDGSTTMIGNQGNGYAKITYLGKK